MHRESKPKSNHKNTGAVITDREPIPSTADRDLTFKRSLYARHGVTEYWVVAEARTIEVLALAQHDFEPVQRYPEGQRPTSPLLAGLNLDTNKIFAD